METALNVLKVTKTNAMLVSQEHSSQTINVFPHVQLDISEMSKTNHVNCCHQDAWDKPIQTHAKSVMKSTVLD